MSVVKCLQMKQIEQKFRILFILLSGCCCYLGCSNFSTILLIVIRISWNQNVFNMRQIYLSASRTIITSINGTVFWTIFRTIFGTVLYGTVFLYFSMLFWTVLYWTVLYGIVLYRHEFFKLTAFKLILRHLFKRLRRDLFCSQLD